MKFMTIMTSGYPLKEKFRRLRDWAAMEIGSRLPLRIRYWVTLIEIGKATRESMNIPATPLDEVLRHLEAPKSMS